MMLLVVSAQVQAAPLDDVGLMDNILNRYSNVAGSWATVIQDYAIWMFWSLTIISMVWTFGLMAMQGEGISSILAEIVKFFTVTGFFLYLLKNGPAISIAIQDSLRQLAANASGMSDSFSPSDIVNIGFEIVSRVVDQSSIWSPADTIVGMLLAAVILCILALIAVNMLILLITGWILSYAGIFLLGFGGGRWTSDIAVNYFKTVLGVGLQLFTMVLLVGIGKTFIDQYYQAMGDGAVNLKSMFVMLVSSIVLLVLVNKIPPMIGSIPGGASMGGIGGFGAGALIGAVGGAGAAITTAGGAIVLGGAGGASALKAAFESAQQAMSEESGSGGYDGGEDTGAVMPSGDGDTGGAGGYSSGSSGPSQGFMGFSKAGQMASHMATSVADGVSASRAANHEGKMQMVKERIAGTGGGQLASQIRQQTAAHVESGMARENRDKSMSDSGASQQSDLPVNQSDELFGGDNIGGVQQPNDIGDGNQEDEYTQFIKKGNEPKNE